MFYITTFSPPSFIKILHFIVPRSLTFTLLDRWFQETLKTRNGRRFRMKRRRQSAGEEPANSIREIYRGRKVLEWSAVGPRYIVTRMEVNFVGSATRRAYCFPRAAFPTKKSSSLRALRKAAPVANESSRLCQNALWLLYVHRNTCGR